MYDINLLNYTKEYVIFTHLFHGVAEWFLTVFDSDTKSYLKPIMETQTYFGYN